MKSLSPQLPYTALSVCRRVHGELVSRALGGLGCGELGWGECQARGSERLKKATGGNKLVSRALEELACENVKREAASGQERLKKATGEQVLSRALGENFPVEEVQLVSVS